MEEYLARSGLLFVLAFTISATLTPCIIWITRRLGLVAHPREDRWHNRPTALFGGIAIFTAFFAPFCALEMKGEQAIFFITSTTLLFLIGLVDDIKELSPQGKFLAQLAVSSLIVASGFRLQFGIPAISIILTIFWITALVNAFNILDNMDGLSAGISLVSSASFFAFAYLNQQDPFVMKGAALLGGAVLGFFIYNFNPARIFMGDCGSLFIGGVAAMLSIMSTWHKASGPISTSGLAGPANLLLVLSVPVSILIVPIFDTALVSFTRTQNGRSIFKGGRDHTSHRLVLLGLSEPKTVLLLMLWASVISGVTIVLSRHSVEGLFVALLLTAILALFFGIFLIHQTRNIYSESKGLEDLQRGHSIVGLILNKKQMLQALLDTLLVSLAYIAAYLLRFEGRIDAWNMGLIEKSLPIIIGIKVVSFWAFGLYRGQWRFVGIWDLFQLIKAVMASSLVCMTIFLFLYRFQGFSRIVFVNDAILTFLFIGGVRLLLRLFKEYFDMEREKGHTTPILIVGAGDGGDLFLRELRKNQNHDYLPVGFIDDDRAKRGQVIHGVKVLGDRHDIPELVKRYGIKKIFVAIMSVDENVVREFQDIAKRLRVSCIKVPSLLPPKLTKVETDPRKKVVRLGRAKKKKS